MATTKVGIYRKYHGEVPTNASGQPLPRSQWPKKRPFRWAVRWFGQDGNRYSKSCRDRKEAQRYAETQQQDVRDHKAVTTVRVSLRQFHQEHRVLMEGSVARTTLALHMAAVEVLAESVGWDRKMDQVTARDIEAFRARRLRSGIRPSTANKEVKILRRIFNLAALRGYVGRDRNPCVGIPMLRVGPTRPRYISPESFQAIYSRAEDTFWRALLVVLYTTGLRLREVMHLLWRDVDFDEQRLHVTRRTGGGFIQPWTPKDHEMRCIPLPAEAVSLLATWQAVAPEGCPYVFVDEGRWEYYRAAVEAGQWRPQRDLVNNFLRRFKTLCRRAGVGPFTIHDIRRSCITNWAKGLAIHVVQQLAGHSDIKTTQQFYLSVQPEDLARAQALQSEAVAGIPAADLTDPKLTHFAQKRVFPGRQGRKAKTKALD